MWNKDNQEDKDSTSTGRGSIIIIKEKSTKKN